MLSGEESVVAISGITGTKGTGRRQVRAGTRLDIEQTRMDRERRLHDNSGDISDNTHQFEHHSGR